VVQVQQQAAISLLVDALDLGIELQIQPLVLHGDHHMVTQSLIKTPQELLAPVQQTGLAAQTVEYAGEFDCDIPPADNSAAGGQLLEIENLIGGNDVLATGELGNEGPASGRQQYALRRETLVTYGHRVRIQQTGSTMNQRDTGAGQQVVIDAVEAGYLGVLVLYQALPVEGFHRAIPAMAPGVLDVLGEMCGVGQQLLGHTAHVDAGASQMELFGYRNPRAEPGGHAAGTHAAGAGADNETIKIKLRHARCPFRNTRGPAYPICATAETRRYGRLC